MDNDLVTISRDELSDLMQDAVRRALLEVGLGGDTSELQRDMVHLRKWRVSVDAASTTTFKVAVTTITAGIFGMIWLGIQVVLKQPPN